MRPVKNDSSIFAHSTKVGTRSQSARGRPWKKARYSRYISSAKSISPQFSGNTAATLAIPPMTSPCMGLKTAPRQRVTTTADHQSARPGPADHQQQPGGRQPQEGAHDHERTDRDLFRAGTIGGWIRGVDRHQLVNELVNGGIDPLVKPVNIDPGPAVFRVRENIRLERPSLLGDQLAGFRCNQNCGSET